MKDTERIADPEHWPLAAGLVLLIISAVAFIVSKPGVPIPIETFAAIASIITLFVLWKYVIDTAGIRRAAEDTLRRQQTPLLRFEFVNCSYHDFGRELHLRLRVINLAANVAIIRPFITYYWAGQSYPCSGVYNNESNYVIWPGDNIEGHFDVTAIWKNPQGVGCIHGQRDIDVLLQVPIYGSRRTMLYVHRREWRCIIRPFAPQTGVRKLHGSYPHTVIQHPADVRDFDMTIECPDVEGLDNLP